jgi:pimeloyl-ACP methyl ester carboxylesterase
MGAAIAIEAAALADAALVAGVVAYAPSADFHRSLRMRLRDQGYPARPMTDLALLALRLAGIRPADAARAAPRVRCPLLVIHGGADRVCPPADAALVASLAPEGAARPIDGAGHLDFHAAGAAEHARLVRGFVERVSRAARSAGAHPRAGGNPAEVIR